MSEQSAVRDIPAPKYEVLATTIDNDAVKQYHVKLQHMHNIRVLALVDESGKVQPPAFGETNYALVTVRDEEFDADGETRRFKETTVHASDADAQFYNACMYAVPKVAEVWEVMYAIGEI